MSQCTVNLHLTPDMRQMSVYHLCYCLQSLLSLLRQKLVLKQSKSVTAKCTETLLPPPCIQFSLLELKSPADRDPKVASFDVKINEHFVFFKLNLTTITLLFKNELLNTEIGLFRLKAKFFQFFYSSHDLCGKYNTKTEMGTDNATGNSRQLFLYHFSHNPYSTYNSHDHKYEMYACSL